MRRYGAYDAFVGHVFDIPHARDKRFARKDSAWLLKQDAEHVHGLGLELQGAICAPDLIPCRVDVDGVQPSARICHVHAKAHQARPEDWREAVVE